MATETQVLDGVLASSNLNNATVANLQAVDANWATATANNVNPSVRASFPTPSGNPTTAAAIQTIRVQSRKMSTNTGNPTISVAVGFNGTQVSSLGNFSVSAAPSSSQTNSWGFNFSSLVAAGAAPDGSDLEVFVTVTAAGGSPSARNSVDIGFIAWDVDYTPPPSRHPVSNACIIG